MSIAKNFAVALGHPVIVAFSISVSAPTPANLRHFSTEVVVGQYLTMIGDMCNQYCHECTGEYRIKVILAYSRWR